MEIPGPCSVCGRIAVLRTCGLCGVLVCATCDTTGRHAHGGRGAPPPRPHGRV